MRIRALAAAVVGAGMLGALMSAPANAAPTAAKLPTITYQTFRGASLTLTPCTTFQSQDAWLVAQYEANTALTLANTLAVDKSPGLYTGFWNSMMMQLAYRHGGQTFVSRFWRYATTEPAATSTAGAVTHWLHAANYASCVDLSAVFYNRWGLPHPDGTVSPRLAASAVPEPVGHC